MPPRFSTATSSPGAANSAAWSAGTSGAPWPPAATSRLRKSQTTSMPAKLGQQGAVHELQRVAGAVELLRPVAHGLAMRADGAHLRRLQPRVAQQRVDDTRRRPASRRCRPTRRGATRRRRGRSVASKRVAQFRRERRMAMRDHADGLRARCGQIDRASTPSTPSSDVPDIRPTYRLMAPAGDVRCRHDGAAADRASIRPGTGCRPGFPPGRAAPWHFATAQRTAHGCGCRWSAARRPWRRAADPGAGR